MSQALPAEFDVLENQIEDMPGEVVRAFQYGLAHLLVKKGRLSDVSNSGDVVHFRSTAGSEFELQNPNLTADQAKLVEDHLRWLLEL